MLIYYNFYSTQFRFNSFKFLTCDKMSTLPARKNGPILTYIRVHKIYRHLNLAYRSLQCGCGAVFRNMIPVCVLFYGVYHRILLVKTVVQNVFSRKLQWNVENGKASIFQVAHSRQVFDLPMFMS